MSTQLQKRRGTTAEHNSFTGAEGELTIDTTKDTAVVHDGVTTGGQPLAREDLDNVASSDVVSKLASQTLNNITFTGTTTVAGLTTSDNITFGDNDKAIFGAGSDLQIYHDGDDSYIYDGGTGNLKVLATNLQLLNAGGTQTYASFFAGGSANLFYNNDARLATTSTGTNFSGDLFVNNGAATTVDIGRGSTSGDSSVLNIKKAYNGTAKLDFLNSGTFDSVFRINIADTEAVSFDWNYDDGVGADRDITFTADGARNLLNLNSNGDISFYEDTGTTAKFFWDASAESLGIGTSSPTEPLTVNGDIKTFTTYNDASKEIACRISSDNTFAGTLAPNIDMRRWTGSASTHAAGGIAVLNDATMRFYLSYESTNTASNDEVMRIDSSGNVGIGTSSPSEKLHISNSSNVYAKIERTGQGHVLVAAEAGTNSIYSRSSVGAAYPLLFRTGNTERMRIDSSGNLLVGTTDTIIWNDASGEGVAISPNVIQVSRNSDTCLLLNRQTNDGSIQVFASRGVNVGNISVTSSATSYNTSSDYRLKTDVQPMTGATERLKALKPVNFEWISSGERVDGFIAHEAQEVVPEAVTGTKDAMRTEEYEVTPAVLDDDGNVVTEAVMGEREVPDYQGIDQSKLVPLLVATIQELEARITQLENS